MPDLHKLVVSINSNPLLGMHSKTSKTIEHGLIVDHLLNNVPVKHKPGQQLLLALGGTKTHSDLSEKGAINTTNNHEVEIHSLIPHTIKSTITLLGALIDRLFKSSKLYINTALFGENDFQSVAEEQRALKEVSAEGKKKAIGVCHAQEIILLVDYTTSEHGRAHITALPDQTKIDDKGPLILLLSTAKIHASDFDSIDERRLYIEGMYRNLLDSAVQEQRHYLIMPASGFNHQEQDAQLYLELLMSVAEEYPELNILYNAGEQHDKLFDKIWSKTQPGNVGRITKDILCVAHYMMKAGYACAVHNPSSRSVIYGLADVGKHWQKTTTVIPERTSLQAIIGMVTTAVLNSFGINPEAFNRITARPLTKRMPGTETVDIPPAPIFVPEIKTQATETIHPDEPPKEEPIGTRQPLPPVVEKNPSSEPIEVKTSSAASGNLGFFPPVPAQTEQMEEVKAQTKESVFSNAQILDIHETIRVLSDEISSCVPYFNKGRKHMKKEALEELLLIGRTTAKDIPEALASIKDQYPNVLAGWTSRTAALFTRLEQGMATTNQKYKP